MLTKRVIYQEMQKDFFVDVLDNVVAEKMLREAENIWLHPWSSEINSWMNNARSIKNLLEKSEVKDTYVTFEYLVPYNKKRIDCMIYGRWNDDKGNVVHIELKQWSNSWVRALDTDWNFEENEEYNVEAYTWHWNRVVAHPSQQVRWYNDYLTWFIEVLSTEELWLTWMAYCYNYVKEEWKDLYDHRYDELQRQFRTYSWNEVKELASKIHEVLEKWDWFSIFNKMVLSPIKPSKKLLEAASNMIHEWNVKAFSLIDDQIVAKNIIMDKIRKIKTSWRKSVIIVKWWPWTWKTVIALNIVAELSKKNYSVAYATKSKPLREWILNRLPRWSASKILFKWVFDFTPYNCTEDWIDVLLVDEAHRIAQSANHQYMKAEQRTNLSQLETLIRASKVWVFFIDDLQAIRSVEICTSEMIKDVAIQYWCDIEEVELKSQFRCNWSDNYLDWLDSILYNKSIKAKFLNEEFDFKVFDSPEELYNVIREKDSNNWSSARLTAWFCRPWSWNLDENWELVKDVHIWNFAMPWETKDTIKKIPEWYVKWYEWAYKPEWIKQVWCIYTAQWFEFDYIGVIIWPDLKVESGKLVTDKTATQDPVLKRSWDWIDWYIRNIYRVLMSRWMKGCYIYCTDPGTREYFRKMME